MKRVILFGFKGCGKSYWGKQLSKETGAHFIDTDSLIEEACGATCKEIYLKQGSDAFRALEHEAVCSLKRTEAAVIALGGGTPLYQNNLRELKELGELIYLKVGPEVLRGRFSRFAGYESFDAFYEERLPLYGAIAAHIVDLDKMNETKVMERFKELMYGK